MCSVRYLYCEGQWRWVPYHVCTIPSTHANGESWPVSIRYISRLGHCVNLPTSQLLSLGWAGLVPEVVQLQWDLFVVKWTEIAVCTAPPSHFIAYLPAADCIVVIIFTRLPIRPSPCGLTHPENEGNSLEISLWMRGRRRSRSILSSGFCSCTPYSRDNIKMSNLLGWADTRGRGKCDGR